MLTNGLPSRQTRRGDIDDIAYYIAKESGSLETARRVIEALFRPLRQNRRVEQGRAARSVRFLPLLGKPALAGEGATAEGRPLPTCSGSPAASRNDSSAS
jgi:hypothetical protein